MEVKNIHEGHRERMLNKFIQAPEMFSEHEILEVLLFYVMPRKDTNALAHKILKMFGGLKGVFSAKEEQLVKVDGVGKRTAAFILAIGQAILRVSSLKDEKKEYLNTPEKMALAISPCFYGQQTETFVLVLLDKNYGLLAKVMFSDKNRSQVRADIPEIITALEMHRPDFAIIAHNHPSYNIKPSREDDFTTKKINVICELYDVILADHLIFAGDNVYSYKNEGKIDEIRQTAVLNKLFEKIKEN